jgi:hypothetical protein
MLNDQCSILKLLYCHPEPCQFEAAILVHLVEGLDINALRLDFVKLASSLVTAQGDNVWDDNEAAGNGNKN